MKPSKTTQRKRRHVRIRAKLSGTAHKPRLVVYRSLKANYAQLVDDNAHKILCSASDKQLKVTGTKTAKAKNVGLEIAKKANALSIQTCIFDRNGYKYHGRVKAIAEGAREGGLKF